MAENEKISTVKVIDDFLPQKQFEEIREIIMNDDKCIANQQSIGWNITTTVAHIEEQENWKYFYMTHMVHDGERIDSLLVYKKIIPILKKLKVKALIRIKCVTCIQIQKQYTNMMNISILTLLTTEQFFLLTLVTDILN